MIINFIKRNLNFRKVGRYLVKNSTGIFPSFVYKSNNVVNERLFNITILAIQKAQKINLSDFQTKFSNEFPVNDWPGEHYRLLAAIVDVIKPKLVIEIGTYTGQSALIMKKFLPSDGRIITYDVIPWNDFSDTGLQKFDFDDQFEQRIKDLTIKEDRQSEINIFKQADLIFVDAAKDGKMEKIFCNFFDGVQFEKSPIVIFDDIKMLNMIKIWNNIEHPKIDLTSFGHWSGTGVVEWI